MFNLQHNFASLGDDFYSVTEIQPLLNQRLIEYNASLAEQLNIDFKDTQTQSTLIGKTKLTQSVSMIYAGHQFGGFSPQLGDGRGVLLGDVLANDGKHYDLHMKGAGLTPYSRQGDGRAVLRSCMREYLASEAMAGLGIATSRALALYDSDEPVYREGPEKGAMLLRTARCHIRFGHFEFFFSKNKQTQLNELIDHCLTNYFPQCKQTDNPIISMLNDVVDRTALMIAKWQAIGFQHGVMNTDNMSILGETIDYGPFEFMNDYEPTWICNHSDHEGRYAFERQPGVALWNLNCLLRCFSKHLERDQLVAILENYEPKLIAYYKKEIQAKLGFKKQLTTDDKLIDDLFSLLEKEKMDYTLFFRNLSNMSSPQDKSKVLDDVVDTQPMDTWLDQYNNRCQQEGTDWSIKQLEMRKTNPKYILRNYLAQKAITQAEQGDYDYFRQLLHILKAPFDEHLENESFSKRPPEWSKKLVISCSS